MHASIVHIVSTWSCVCDGYSWGRW